jgi:hypothetical protein
MNKFLLPLAGVLLIIAAGSCSTKFNVAAPYKNVTVVYGLLDLRDTAHYIRIEKAFMDEHKSALTMAQVADSSYYPGINVRLERISFLDTTRVADTFHLSRVDMYNEGYSKPSGTFFSAPNYAYKFKGTLDPVNSFYRLVITNYNTGETDSVETPIINDMDSTVFYVPLFDLHNSSKLQTLDFPSVFYTYQIGITYTPPSNYAFMSTTSPVEAMQCVIRFHYNDSNIDSHVNTPQYFDYSLGTVLANNFDFVFQTPDVNIYYAIRDGMGQAPTNTLRVIQPAEIFVYAGTPDLYTYTQSSAMQGTGLTGDDVEPIYTNVSGANVLGLFTSRAVRSKTISLGNETLDSLYSSSIMQGVGIVQP